MRGARLMGPSHNEPPDLPGAGDGGKIKGPTARTSASPRILHSEAARPIALQRECHLLSDKCIGLIHTGGAVMDRRHAGSAFGCGTWLPSLSFGQDYNKRGRGGNRGIERANISGDFG